MPDAAILGHLMREHRPSGPAWGSFGLAPDPLLDDDQIDDGDEGEKGEEGGAGCLPPDGEETGEDPAEHQAERGEDAA